ncbi:MAG: hypothetical protein J3Q66DRAFT_340579 [Benniella sp.]|nr:MAG: hypothetical protein J3Q66DRAFT_340579 [Benniella sp.]
MVKLAFSIAATVAMMASVANAAGCLRFNERFKLKSRDHGKFLSKWVGGYVNAQVMNGAGAAIFFETLTFCVVTEVISQCQDTPPDVCVPRATDYYIKAEGKNGYGYLSYVGSNSFVWINPSTAATKFNLWNDPPGLRIREPTTGMLVTSERNLTSPEGLSKVAFKPATIESTQVFEIVR